MNYMFCQFFLSFFFFFATSVDLKDVPVLAKVDVTTAVFKPNTSPPQAIKPKHKVNGGPVGPRPANQLKMSFIRQTEDGKWDVGIPIALWQRFKMKHPSYRLPSQKHISGRKYIPKQKVEVGPETAPQVSWEYMELKKTQTAVIPSATGFAKDPIFLEYWGPNSAVLPPLSTLDIKRLTPALPMSEDGFWHVVFESEKDASAFVRLVTGAGQPIPDMPNTIATDIARHPPRLTEKSEEYLNGGIVIDELIRSQGQQTQQPRKETQVAEYAANTPEFVSTNSN